MESVLAIHDSELLTYISKGLYVEIASRFQTSIGCVERDIRTVIKTIWEHGDKILLYEVFGFEIAQKPRNGTFIDAVAYYVVEHYYDKYGKNHCCCSQNCKNPSYLLSLNHLLSFLSYKYCLFFQAS